MSEDGPMTDPGDGGGGRGEVGRTWGDEQQDIDHIIWGYGRTGSDDSAGH